MLTLIPAALDPVAENGWTRSVFIQGLISVLMIHRIWSGVVNRENGTGLLYGISTSMHWYATVDIYLFLTCSLSVEIAAMAWLPSPRVHRPL